MNNEPRNAAGQTWDERVEQNAPCGREECCPMPPDTKGSEVSPEEVERWALAHQKLSPAPGSGHDTTAAMLRSLSQQNTTLKERVEELEGLANISHNLWTEAEAENERLDRDIGALLANLDWLADIGDGLDPDDAIIVSQIKRDHNARQVLTPVPSSQETDGEKK